MARSNYFLVIVFLSLGICAAVYTQNNNNATTRFLATWSVDESYHKIICVVTEADSAGYKIRKVIFYQDSVQRVKIIEVYEEISSIIAVFPVRDVSPNLITIWEGGSAYEVIVFSYLKGKIRKTLDVGTRSFPELIYDNKDSEIPSIMITDYDWRKNKKSGEPDLVPVFATIYSWTGSKYSRSPKVAWAKRFSVVK